MTDPRDRILDSALERMFEEERGRDSVERIVAAWKRGVQGSGLEGLHMDIPTGAPEVRPQANGRDEEDRGPRPRPSLESGAVQEVVPVVRTRWVLRAAAAVLVLGAGFTFWLRSNLAPGVAQLVADGRVAVATATGDLSAARTLPPGLRVVVDRGAPVGFSWSPGADTGEATRARDWRVVAADQTAFEWHPGDRDELVLWMGELELDAPTTPIDLDLTGARLTLDAGASVVVRVERAAHARPDFAGAADESPERLSVSVLSGSAALVYGTFEQRLTQGEARDLPGDPERWWQETGEPVAAFCAELPGKAPSPWRFSPEGWLERWVEFDAAAGKLVSILEEDPFAWPVLERVFRKARVPGEPAIPGECIDFLAWELSPRALELARTLWLESPQSFNEGHLVAFASFGGFEFERELRALVEADPVESGLGVMAAAYFARKGDEIGRARLREFAEPRDWTSPYGGMDGWIRTLLACAALDWLGDRQPWEDLSGHLREEVPAALAGGLLSFASYSVVFADYFAVQGRDVLARSPLDVGLALHYKLLGERADTPGKVRDLLEDVASRW